MLELEEALENILSVVQPLGNETVPLSESLHRYVASPLHSPINLPPFDNSAMDGYAVRATEVASASPEHPVPLKILGKAAAGGLCATPLLDGTCVRIFTGSAIPSDASAVVMQEDVRLDPANPGRIWVTEPVKLWENIRFAGEDLKAGALLLRSGESLTAARCSLLAACGFSSVPVACRPTIGLLATGTELVPAGEALPPGKIYESNRLGLSMLAQQAGAVVRNFGLVKDTLEETTAALEAAFAECDAVITSGGVSVGEFDFVRSAFLKLGGTLALWKVAIKPGKPFAFGQWKNKLLFGVPGNPVSALVTAHLLVRPALLRFQGANDLSPTSHPVTLSEPVSNPGDRRHFVRISIDPHGNAAPTGIQASHILSSLAAANGILDVPPRSTLAKGKVVRALRWDH